MPRAISDIQFHEFPRKSHSLANASSLHLRYLSRISTIYRVLTNVNLSLRRDAERGGRFIALAADSLLSFARNFTKLTSITADAKMHTRLESISARTSATFTGRKFISRLLSQLWLPNSSPHPFSLATSRFQLSIQFLIVRGIANARSHSASALVHGSEQGSLKRHFFDAQEKGKGNSCSAKR